MSFDAIPLPSVWDVPVAIGVPVLLGNSIGAGVSASASTALGGIIQNWTTAQSAKLWGIFDEKNNSVATVSHVQSIDYNNSYSVPNAPLTNGSFASFNKVKNPFVSRVYLVCDGTESGSSELVGEIKAVFGSGTSNNLTVRKSFVDALELAVASTSLYSVVTPERTYLNANIVGYAWRRSSSQGVTMLVAELSLVEIRNTGTLFYSKSKTAAGAQQVSNGTVQTQELPSAATSTVSTLQSQAASSPAS